MSIKDARGVALVGAMMAMTLLASLAAAIVLTTVTESTISVSYGEGTATFYAAEAALEYVIQELRNSADWHDVVSGKAASAFVDGAPGGVRTVGAGQVDLAAATADLNALSPGGTSAYVLYSYGYLADLIPPVEPQSLTYVIAWVADRTPEGAADAVVGVAAQAYGPTGSRRGVEATVRRAGDPTRVRRLTWSELR